MQFIYVAVDDLIPYVNNARTHSDEQVMQIASSIKEFGFINPIITDGKNSIIAGHGRLMAARKLRMKTVPVITVDHLTDAQRRAYIIIDNKLALNSGWDDELLKIEIEVLSDLDFNIDLLGFSDDELDLILFDNDAQDGLTEDDDAPPIPDESITRRGDIWLCGDHRVMCGDSTCATDVEKLLNDRKIDLIFSDPPYGVSYADKNAMLNAFDKGNRIQTEIKNDHMTLEETGRLWADVFSLWSSYLANYSSYYIASPQGGDLYLMMMMMMNENGMPLKHTIIWNKNNHVLGRCDYNYKHEPIIYGWSKKHKFYGRGTLKNSVWDIPKPQKNDLHPTMKPVALVENCILNSSESNQIVADMFLGSGTTLIAAQKTGRICYGMELDEKYCDVIVKRWQDFSGKQAILEATGATFEG